MLLTRKQIRRQVVKLKAKVSLQEELYKEKINALKEAHDKDIKEITAKWLQAEQETRKQLNEEIDKCVEKLSDMTQEKHYWKVKYADLKLKEEDFARSALELQAVVDSKNAELRKLARIHELIKAINKDLLYGHS